nr:transposase (putative), gypsy type [Tanacetum cinerariifolium]
MSATVMRGYPAIKAFYNVPKCIRGNDTMHERHAGKIGLYNSFFDFANFRLPLSTFLVDVLRHFRINISQLSVIGAAKVDDLACPASFLWHTAKHVSRDPDLVAADFNEKDYATLVANPSSFRKFPEAFMCMVGQSRHYTLDEKTYSRFLHKNGEGEPLLLETTIGRIVPLLPVVPDRTESKLDASVERLFDEGGSGNQTEQGDFKGGGKDADIQPVIKAADTVVEDVALVQPKRQRKRKYVVVDAGEASHPLKKLREDHGTLSGTSVGGKSVSAVKGLLARVVLNAEVGVAAIPTLPFMKTSISTMSEREGGDHTDSVAGLNLRAIGVPSKFVISSYYSHHSDTNVVEVKVNSDNDNFLLQLVELIPPRVASRTLLAVTFLLVVFAPSSTLMLKSVVEKQVELLKVKNEEIENLKAQLLLRETKVAKVIRLRAQASNFKAVEKPLRDETNTLKERNAILEKERNDLDAKVTELEASATGKEHELTDLNALITSVKSQNDNLID